MIDRPIRARFKLGQVSFIVIPYRRVQGRMSHKHMFVAPWVSLYVEIFINNDLVVIINTAIYVSTYLSHFFENLV